MISAVSWVNHQKLPTKIQEEFSICYASKIVTICNIPPTVGPTVLLLAANINIIMYMLNQMDSFIDR